MTNRKIVSYSAEREAFLQEAVYGVDLTDGERQHLTDYCKIINQNVALIDTEYQSFKTLLQQHARNDSGVILSSNDSQPFLEALNEAKDFYLMHYNEVWNIINYEENNGLKMIFDVLKSAQAFTKISLDSTATLESKNQAKQAFQTSTDTLSRALSPTLSDKFLGACLTFVGSILALVTVGCWTSPCKQGYRLFTGYHANQVNGFKSELIAMNEMPKQRLAKS